MIQTYYLDDLFVCYKQNIKSLKASYNNVYYTCMCDVFNVNFVDSRYSGFWVGVFLYK